MHCVNEWFSRSGVDENHGRILLRSETRRVVDVHDGAAAEHRAELVRMKGVSKLLPMEEVFGDGVAPSHVAPVGSVGIMLEEEMVFAFVEDESVGVVRPAEGGREAKPRPQRLLVDVFWPRSCGAIAVLRVDGVVVVDGNGQRLAGECADGDGREPVRGFSVGELHVKRFYDSIAAGDGDIDLFSGVVNGKHQPRFCGGDGE